MGPPIALWRVCAECQGKRGTAKSEIRMPEARIKSKIRMTKSEAGEPFSPDYSPRSHGDTEKTFAGKDLRSSTSHFSVCRLRRSQKVLPPEFLRVSVTPW